MEDYKVKLEVFEGPLDLLLYLIKRDEVDIYDISIERITKQYLSYLGAFQVLKIELAGEFIVMAANLLYIKSRTLLPVEQQMAEEDAEEDDPRWELIRQLIEYKKFKDAASMLEERSRDWQQRHGRVASDRPDRKRDLSQEELQEVELWDLVSAFGRIMRDIQAAKPSNIVYDDTPIHVYMAQINQRLVDDGRLAFRELFQPGLHKSALIGMFLAILELVRHHQVRTDQNHLFGEIWVYPGPSANAALDVAKVDTYEHGGGEQREPE